MSDDKDKTKVEEPCEAERLEGEAQETEAAPPPDEADGWRLKYLRSLADLDNFRKRTERDRDQSRAFALEGLMRELLPVLDDLELAIGAEGDADAIREGVELALKRALKVLENEGLKSIDAIGRPFDPYVHEAMGAIPSDESPGTVVTELTKGYLLHERVLRPSRVQIAAQPPGQEDE